MPTMSCQLRIPHGHHTRLGMSHPTNHPTRGDVDTARRETVLEELCFEGQPRLQEPFDRAPVERTVPRMGSHQAQLQSAVRMQGTLSQATSRGSRLLGQHTVLWGCSGITLLTMAVAVWDTSMPRYSRHLQCTSWESRSDYLDAQSAMWILRRLV